MDIIKSSDSKYEEYETMLLERDQISKRSGQIWTAYNKEFGQLICAVYEEMIECVKNKKIIAFYQEALNRGGVVDPYALKEHLDNEMASYHVELKRLQENSERSRKSALSTAYEVERSKELYRRIAKLIHPDINPLTDRKEILNDLWMRTVTAYHLNDIKELSELEVMIRKALRDLGNGDIRVDIPDIDKKIRDLKNEIHEITHSTPYIYEDLLNHGEKKQEKREELEKKLESYLKYHKELDDVINDMLTNGGIKLKWQMN